MKLLIAIKSRCILKYMCISALTLGCLNGCEEEELPYDTYSDIAICGGEAFAKRSAFGECDRCRTEAGMIRTGRDGQICYNAKWDNAEFDWNKMVLFDSVPLDWWPSDTLYMGGQTFDDGTLRAGSFNVLGQSSDRTEWSGPACPENNEDRIKGGYWSQYMVPQFDDLTTSDGDADMENGEDFSFVIYGPDVNDDCLEDWGYVNGSMRNDTAFAQIVWKVMLWPQELYGDTLLISDIIIVEAPEWAQPKG